MPSSYSARLRLEKQAAGENLNTWGAPKLNTVIDRADFSIAGLSTIALTGPYTLTSSNTADDEARSAILKFTGTGAFTVTIPSVSKVYQVWNACTGVLTVTTGAGATATVATDETCGMICDGANVKKVKVTDYGATRIRNITDPATAQDAATKAYVDATAFSATLPGQAGNAGKHLNTNGSTALWIKTPYRNAAYYGAVGDGVVDDTAALQAAINAAAAAGGGLVVLPNGKYKISSPLTIVTSGVSLRGESVLGTELLLASAAQDGIVLGDGSGTIENINVSDIAINVFSGTVKTAGAGIKADKMNTCVIEKVRIANQFWGINLRNSVLCYLNHVRILNPTAVNGRGVYIDGTSGNDHYLSNVFVSGNPAAQPLSGIEIKYSTGTWISNSGCLSTGIGLLLSPDNDMVVQHIFSTMNAFDTCASHGILIQGSGTGIVNRFFSVQDWASTCALNGVTINPPNGDGFSFLGLRALNNQQHGVQVLKGNGLVMSTCRAEGNGGAAVGTYHGIVLAGGVSEFMIQNCVSGAKEGFPVVQGYGLAITTGSGNNFTVANNDFRGNLTGGLLDGATGSNGRIFNNMGYNPVGAGVVGVGLSPWTFTNSHNQATFYIEGGTVSAIASGGQTLFTSSGHSIELAPNDQLTVTYSVAPTVKLVTH